MSFRLQSALSLVPEGANVIDVGADRGQFSVSLARLKHKVLAIENKNGPYSSLAQTIEEEHNPFLSCHLADGLDYLPKEYDCCCILGMGGMTIKEILSAHPESLSQFKTIIIEPQSVSQQPIEYLLNMGFANDYGQFVYEKRYYPLLRFVPSKEKRSYSALEKKYGPYPVQNKDPLLMEYLNKEIERYQRIDSVEAKQKLAEFEAELQEVIKA